MTPEERKTILDALDRQCDTFDVIASSTENQSAISQAMKKQSEVIGLMMDIYLEGKKI